MAMGRATAYLEPVGFGARRLKDTEYQNERDRREREFTSFCDV